MTNKFQPNKKSFTFVETLVVISVLGLVFPVVFSILFVILQQQMKIFRLTEVKRQGDHIVGFLEDVIKNNAFTIYDGATEICDAALVNPQGVPTSFQDKYNNAFSIDYAGSDLVISYPPPLPPAPTFAFPQGQLTSTKVRIEGFSISCSRTSAFSAPLVAVNFTICYNIGGSCVSARPEEVAVLDYQTSIKLISYSTP